MKDSDEIENFVEQTTELRFSVKFEGLRLLLRECGHDPDRAIQHFFD